MQPGVGAASRWLGAVVALGLCSCGSSEATPAPELPAQTVVLGTGEAAFEPMAGEPPLRLVAGVQGGFHVWASFLVYGFTNDRLDMVLETRVEDDPESALVMRARLTLRETQDENGEPALSFAGFPAQVEDARCAHDKRVSVAVTLSDTESPARATDTRYCIAQVDAQQRQANCE